MMRNKLILLAIVVSVSAIVRSSALAVEDSDNTIIVSDTLTMTDNVITSINKVKKISDTFTIADG